MKRYGINLGLMLILVGALAQAQGPPQAAPPLPPDGGQQRGGPPQPMVGRQDSPPPPPQASRPPLERALHAGPGGRWWNNPDMVQKLALTADQQKRMDEIFQQNRLKLVDLNATVQKEEITLEPLVASEQPDETKILAQIDKVAQARAELEKANARFLLGIRRVLTAEQWKTLQAERPRLAGRGPNAGGRLPNQVQPRAVR
jgi:periplasmic protein CpxP/Spy